MLTFEKKVMELVEEYVAPCPVPGCGGTMNKVKLGYKASILFAVPLGTYGKRDALCCPKCQHVIYPDKSGAYPGMTIASVPQKS